MNQRVRLVLILLILTSQIGIGSTSAIVHAVQKDAAIPPVTSHQLAGPASESTMRATAVGLSKLWHGSAMLAGEVGWLTWPKSTTPTDSSPTSGWSTFIFASGGERLSIVVDRGSGVVLGQHLASIGIPAAQPIDPARFTISSETASTTAERIGAKAYRETCPAHRDLSKVGASFDTVSNTPAWSVTYADDRTSSNPDVIVLIDARTGQVIRKTINVPPCDPKSG